MAAGLGFKDFVTGEVLTSGDVDGYLMQGTWVFASAAARDAAVISPQEGNMCYLKDTDAVQYYSGSAWTAVGGGMTLLSTTSLTGASTTISSISQAYTDLYVLMINATTSSSSVIRFNPNSTTGNGGFTTFNGSTVGTTGEVSTNGSGTAGRGSVLKISDYTSTDWHPAQIYGVDNATAVSAQGSIRLTAAISSIQVATTAGTFSAGTVKIYGVK